MSIRLDFEIHEDPIFTKKSLFRTRSFGTIRPNFLHLAVSKQICSSFWDFDVRRVVS